MIYRWCELAIRTDLDVPELPPFAPPDAGVREWRITLESGAPPERPGRAWFHHWEFPDGRPWVAFARDAGGYLLHFPRLADFDIVPAARTIGSYPQPATPLHTLRHLLLDQVLPLVAGGPDRLALHGSAVATDGGALVFLGGPGEGKSTLAALLVRRGCALVSDDCCLLARAASGVDVVPSYPGVRLAPDSIGEVFGDSGSAHAEVAHYTSKRRVAGRTGVGLAFHTGNLPLSRIYVIDSIGAQEPTAGVSITLRPRSAALFDLLHYTFHLDVGDPVRVREAFDLSADVALQYDVRRLKFPWDLSTADAVAEAILSDG